MQGFSFLGCPGCVNPDHKQGCRLFYFSITLIQFAVSASWGDGSPIWPLNFGQLVDFDFWVSHLTRFSKLKFIWWNWQMPQDKGDSDFCYLSSIFLLILSLFTLSLQNAFQSYQLFDIFINILLCNFRTFLLVPPTPGTTPYNILHFHEQFTN